MPYLPLPDGSYMEVPEGVSVQDAINNALQKYPEAFGAKPADQPKSGLLPALESGAQSGLGDVAQGFGTAVGLQGLADWGKRQQANAATTYKPTTDADIADAEKANTGLFGGIGTRVTQALEPYAQGAGNIIGRYGLPTTAAGLATLALPEEIGAAGIAGAATGTGRILTALGANTVKGAVQAGTFGTLNTATYIGDELNKQKERGEAQDYSSAISYGIAHGAIDQAVGGILHAPMSGVLGKTAAEQATALAPKVLAGDMTAMEAQNAISGTLRSIAQGTAQNAAVGSAMMVGHEALNRSAAGQDLSSPEAIKAYQDNIKGALAFAPIFGAMHGIGARNAAEGEINKAAGTKAGLDLEAQQAAATTPEALRQVYSDYQNAKTQMSALQQDISAARPGKEATDEQKAAFQAAKDAAADHRDNVLKPAQALYEEHKALIDPIVTQDKLVAEQKARLGAPTEPIPTAAQQSIPGMEPEQPGPVQTQATTAPAPDLGAQRTQIQNHINDLQQRMLTSADPAEIAQLGVLHNNATQALSTLPPDPVVAKNQAILAATTELTKAQAALEKAQKSKQIEKIPALAQAVLDAKAKIPAEEVPTTVADTSQGAFNFNEPKTLPDTPTKPIATEGQQAIPGMEPEQPGPTLSGVATPVDAVPDIEKLRGNLTDQIAALEERLSDSAKLTPAQSLPLIEQLNSTKKALDSLPAPEPTTEQQHAEAVSAFDAAQKKVADAHKKWMKAVDEGDWTTASKWGNEHERLVSEMPERPVMPEAPTPEPTAQLPISETANKNYQARDARRQATAQKEAALAEQKRAAEFLNSKQTDLFTGEHTKEIIDAEAERAEQAVGAPTSVPEQLAHLQNKMFLNIERLADKNLDPEVRKQLVAENYAIKEEYKKLSEEHNAKPDPIQATLFSLENLVRTAEDNGNEAEVERLSKIFEALKAKQDARRIANLQRVRHMAEDRNANANDPDLAALRNGEHLSRDKQELFNNLGEEGYNRHVVDAAIERLKAQVTEPRREGEKSLLEQANNLYEDIAALNERKASGTLTAKELSNIEKSITTKTAAYNKIINEKVLPIREKIEKLENGKTTVRDINAPKAKQDLATVAANPEGLNAFDHFDAQKAALEAARATKQKNSSAQKKYGVSEDRAAGGAENAAVRSAAEKGDAQGVFKGLQQSKNPLIRWVGRQAEGLGGVKVEVDAQKWAAFEAAEKAKILADNPRAFDGKQGDIVGMYDHATRTIHINPKYAGAEGSVAHEVVHALVTEALDNPTPAQERFVRKINELSEDMQKNKSLQGEYGITDVHEFVAEALSNKDFQDKLAKIEYYDHSTVWSKFTNAIGKILGWPDNDNALGHLMNLLDAGNITAPREATTNKTLLGKVNPALTNAMQLAKETVGKADRTIMDRVTGKGEARALTIETHMIDQFAPARELGKALPAYKAQQQMFYLSMTRQINNLLGAVLKNGALQRVTKEVDGHKEFVYETKQGANLNDINGRILSKAHALTGSPDATDKLFSLYTIAKRAENVGLSKMNYSSEITQERLNTAMREINAVPGLKGIFDEAQKQYHDFNKGMVEFAAQSGAIAKEVAAKMLASKDYVPYYRENRDGTVSLFMGGEEITKVGNVKEQPALHELVGGDQRIMDFNSAAVQNAQMMLNMGLRNTALKDLAFNLQDTGVGIIGKGAAARSPNTFNFKQDGKDFHVIVSDTPGVPAALLIKGLEGIPIQQSALLKIAGMPSNLLRQIIVANPITAARILYKDTISSAVVSGSNLDVFSDALKNVKSGLLERRGIVGGELFQGLPADMAHLLREAQSGKTGWETLLSKAHVLHAKADALTRQLRYESYLKQGMSEMQATSMALESMNFTRRGISPSIHILNTLNPFINSQIQGLNVLVKALRGNMPYNEKLKIQQKVFQRGMAIAAGSMLYAAIMQDDDAYKNAAPDQKYNNWFMPIPGSNEKFRVPIPFEAGILFKSVPEAMVNMLYGRDKDAAEGMRQALQKLIPGGDTLGIPQIARPLLEAKTGTSFYTGRSIESIHEQQLPAGMRSRPTTTAFADQLGSSLNLSPVMIDHVLNGYTGSLGTAVMGIASAMVFGKQNPEGTAALHGSQMPVIGSVFQPEDAGNIVNEAYAKMNEIKQIKNGYSELVAQGRTQEAVAYRERMANELAMSGAATRFSSGMTKYAKMLQQLKAHPTGTPEQQMQRIDEIKRLRTNFAQQSVAQVDGKK